ncbi:CRISPR system precrRNA processing endoribonuclease RAMP protein Cas6 [Infirmifilum lucidum]|uniref:CRISPR system precrRNA processing endoribonuclease RAMP protein Cas6 n=1 Tax=Infirmifilum lucidum TaxID=2776706 RepID=A0A7L9FIR6_9CREN|nr:CRISPR system precrRNA processing endoribonuclease RAMP protein Cas6 [Infirmifilum lucidum]QOJ78814.1 CRISPR system precrRNA processing endoribonuclease RAMP protein Cas6 [Infirmifilum lucidum]
MAGRPRLYSVSVRLVAMQDTPIVTWSGSFSLKVVYEFLHRSGVDFPKKAEKEFSVEPLAVDGAGGYLLTGLLSRRGAPRVYEVRAGTPLTVTAHFYSEKLASDYIFSIARDMSVSLPSGEFRVVDVSVRQSEPPRPREVPREGVAAEVEFLSPAILMFYGRDVLYPSPARVVLSALRTYSRITGVDTRAASDTVAKTVEAVGAPRYRPVLVDIGEGRVVPAFVGTAVYAIHGSRDAPLIAAALSLAETTGVGQSRALGFGRVRVRWLEGQA